MALFLNKLYLARGCVDTVADNIDGYQKWFEERQWLQGVYGAVWYRQVWKWNPKGNITPFSNLPTTTATDTLGISTQAKDTVKKGRAETAYISVDLLVNYASLTGLLKDMHIIIFCKHVHVFICNIESI